jgi:hypothetical protein
MYFSFISKLDEANAPLPEIEVKTHNNVTDLNVSVEEMSDIIQIIHPNKASGPDVISHNMLKLCPNKIALPLQMIFNLISKFSFAIFFKLLTLCLCFLYIYKYPNFYDLLILLCGVGPLYVFLSGFHW